MDAVHPFRAMPTTSSGGMASTFSARPESVDGMHRNTQMLCVVSRTYLHYVGFGYDQYVERVLIIADSSNRRSRKTQETWTPCRLQGTAQGESGDSTTGSVGVSQDEWQERV